MNTKFCVKNLKGRDSFGGPMRRWEGYFKVDLKRNWVLCCGLYSAGCWALVDMVENFHVP